MAFNHTNFHDPVPGRLHKLIETKARDKRLPKFMPPPVEQSPRVLDLMEALRQSVRATKIGKSKPAVRQAPKPTSKRRARG